MATSSRWIAAAALAFVFGNAGCAGDTFTGEEVEINAADVSGSYTVALTNGENTCATMESTWTEGAETTGIPFTIHQDRDKIWADVEGASAIAFILLTGETRFQGDVDDNVFSLTNFGSRVHTPGEDGNEPPIDVACVYKVNAIIDGYLDADAIQGTLTYEPVFEDESCAEYACQAVQAFSGARPPKT